MMKVMMKVMMKLMAGRSFYSPDHDIDLPGELLEVDDHHLGVLLPQGHQFLPFEGKRVLHTTKDGHCHILNVTGHDLAR